MMKYGLSIAHYRRYIPLIEKETREYFKHWGSSGERGETRRVDINGTAAGVIANRSFQGIVRANYIDCKQMSTW